MPGATAASRTRPPLSALVTTFNEAANIAACIESLSWCDEILVVDSHSTDDTVAIASGFEKVKILQRSYFGGASQKNWAIARTRHDWILILDADERVSPTLRAEIEQQLGASAEPRAFAIPRRTFFLGREIRRSGWQHDRVTRLFRRGIARYPNRRVHADMETRGPVQPLVNHIDHHMVQDLTEYAQRIGRYALWGAAQLWRDGRRARLYEVLARPTWRFLRTYLVQLGITEGVAGLVACTIQAWGTFLKWATLWSWQVGLARGRQPSLPEFDDDETTWVWHSPREHNGRPAGLPGEPPPIAPLPIVSHPHSRE